MPSTGTSGIARPSDDSALARPAGAPPASPEQKENAHLRKQVARLTAELETARKVIEIQSKLSALLDQISTGSSNNNEKP